MKPDSVETATVIKTDGTMATVITNKSKSCQECGKAAAGICGKKGAGMVMKARNTVGAEYGDTVVLGLGKDVHIRGYILVFILPLIAMILGAIAGHWLSGYMGTKGLEAALGIAAFLITAVWSVHKIRRLENSAQMYIEKVLSSSENYSSSRPEEADYLKAFQE